MKIAWCPQHRGVMRIAFFNPPPAFFHSACPRCLKPLIEQERGKYEEEVNIICEFPHPIEEEVTPAPRTLCDCCEHFYGVKELGWYCSWCVDCPVDHCDIPRRFLPLEKKEKNL